MGLWTLAAIAMSPALAANAAADETGDEAPVPLEGSQCWGRCAACTQRCASVFALHRERCERACQEGNDRCCEASGRHGASRACGCY